MWTPVNKIIIFGILFGSTRMLVGAISVIYLVTKGLNVSDIALLKTFQMSVMFMFDIPLAYISDRKSKKISIVLASLFASLWLFLIGNSSTLGWFYIAEFFNAISLSMFNGAFIAYLINMKKHLEDNDAIKEIIGQYNKYHFIGMGFAAYIGSLIAGRSIDGLWILSSVIMLVITITFYFFLPVEPQEEKTSNKHNTPMKELINIFRDIFINSNNNIQVSLFLFIALYYQIIIQFWQLMLNGESITGDYNIHYYGLAFIAILFAQALAGFVIEKFSLKSIVTIFSPLILLVSITIKFIVLDATTMIFLIPLLFFISKIMMLFLQADVHTRIPSKLRATYDSVISTSGKIIIFLVLPIIGYGMEKTNYEATNRYFVIALTVIFFIFTFVVTIYRKRNSEGNL